MAMLKVKLQPNGMQKFAINLINSILPQFKAWYLCEEEIWKIRV